MSKLYTPIAWKRYRNIYFKNRKKKDMLCPEGVFIVFPLKTKNQLFLAGFLVAGTGLEPVTFGLWARRATYCSIPRCMFKVLKSHHFSFQTSSRVGTLSWAKLKATTLSRNLGCKDTNIFLCNPNEFRLYFLTGRYGFWKGNCRVPAVNGSVIGISSFIFKKTNFRLSKIP